MHVRVFQPRVIQIATHKRTAQIGVAQVGTTQIRINDAGTSKIGPGKPCGSQVAFLNNSAIQVRPVQDSLFHLRVFQPDTAEVGPREIAVIQDGRFQKRTGQICVSQIRVAQIDPLSNGSAEIHPGQVKAVQTAVVKKSVCLENLSDRLKCEAGPVGTAQQTRGTGRHE